MISDFYLDYKALFLPPETIFNFKVIINYINFSIVKDQSDVYF